MANLKPRIDRLEAARAKRYHEVAQRLLGLLTPAEVLALAEGLTASHEDTWEDLPADTQALAWTAYDKIRAGATPAERAMFWGDTT